MGLMREHSIVLPADLSMLFKALITLEGFARQLDPDFKLIEHLSPFVRHIIMSRYTPKAIAGRSGRSMLDLLGMIGNPSRDMVRLVKGMRRGKFHIDIDVKRLDHFGYQIDKSANRLPWAS